MSFHRVSIVTNEPIGLVRPELHGHFAEHLGACVNEGLWVGEKSPLANELGFRADVLAALQKLNVPVLRWPGGCFADDYHWPDGVGPRHARPTRINSWWGHTIEDNAFGTQEFIKLCRLLGAKPYLAGNVGSGSPDELKSWVEYCNFDGPTTTARRRVADGSPEPFGVEYWGVGNELWGCGGNMSPEDYAAAYKRFATFLSTFSRPPTNMPLYLIACGPNGNDLDWTRRFFERAGTPGGDWSLHGFAAHYYCGSAGTATEYSTHQWYELLEKATRMEKLILDQRAAMDQFDPQRKIGLIVDEWGTWHPAPPERKPGHLWQQQSTLRDGLVAALTLDCFNRHADKVVMANIAQIVNVLQSVILTDGDKMVLTPTYHVFDLYQCHQNATAVRSEIQTAHVRFPTPAGEKELPILAGSATIKGNLLQLSLVNSHATESADVRIDLDGPRPKFVTRRSISAESLTAHNTYDEPDVVRITDEGAMPVGAELRFTLKPASVNLFQFSR